MGNTYILGPDLLITGNDVCGEENSYQRSAGKPADECTTCDSKFGGKLTPIHPSAKLHYYEVCKHVYAVCISTPCLRGSKGGQVSSCPNSGPKK